MKMRKFILFAVFALVVAAGTSAYAELKNVEVGGMLRFRGERMDPWLFNDNDPGQDFISTTTRLNIGAELTEGVSAFFELQDIEIWGTAAGPMDGSAEIGMPLTGVPSLLCDEMYDDFSLYQGYILIQDVGGYEGLALKIGRQEVTFGTEFILGNNDFGPGLSHDAVAAVYGQDDMTVILVAAKIVEGITVGGTEDDADVDLYAILSSYTGLEDAVIDAYFLFLRSADLVGSGPIFPPVAPEVPTDQESSQLYTIGARIGGMWDAMDYNLEGAFQFGDNGWGGDFESWAVDAGIGYTFDMDMQPRLGFTYTFMSGDDDENDDNIETFIAPLADNYHRYGYMDLFGSGNLNVMKLSATACPTEKIGVCLHALHLLAVEHEDQIAPLVVPTASVGNDGTNANADTIGTELDLVLDYAYSEDLDFELAFAYLFAGPYIEDVFGSKEDMYRIYLQAKLVF
jgi:hypothetical protein